jgi:dTDP-4-amino-4,6-dideoxygalactose transaminase
MTVPPVNIPFNRLWTSHEKWRVPLLDAMQRVVRSGRFVLGSEVKAFEQEFCAYLGSLEVAGGVGVASGTDALTLGLLAGGIGPGCEVLLPAFGPGATITGILATGATPVPVDVTPQFRLDQTLLEEALTPRTKALVAVHLFGRPDHMPALRSVARRHNLWLVEDCAQAHGAEIWEPDGARWKKAGTFGDVAAFSFYPTKNLGATGDAGICVARTPATCATLSALRQYGWKTRDKAACVGRNSRMDELQAAVLRVGLPHLDILNQHRTRLVGTYEKLLQGLPEMMKPEPCAERFASKSACHLFTIRVQKRNVIRRYLAARGVGCGVHYPLAHTQQAAFKGFGRAGGYPVAERLAREVLSLPLHPFLEDADVERTVGCLVEFWNSL